MQKKLGVDFRKYKILGACNPSFAHQALMNEGKLGVFLPCNVIIQEIINSSEIEVTIINPIVAIKSVDNPQLESFAKEVSDLVQQVMKNLK